MGVKNTTKGLIQFTTSKDSYFVNHAFHVSVVSDMEKICEYQTFRTPKNVWIVSKNAVEKRGVIVDLIIKFLLHREENPIQRKRSLICCLAIIANDCCTSIDTR